MNRILFNIIWFVLKAVAALPFRVLYLLSDFTYIILRYVLRYRDKVIRGNLERSFPEKNAKDIQIIMNEFYHHIADLIFETIKLLHISEKQLEEHINVLGGNMIEQLATDGRPIVVFLGHYGNWEWIQEVTRHYQRPAINAELYRPLNSPVMNEIMHRIRARFDTTPIPHKKAFRQLIAWKNEGIQYLVGFIADQRPYAFTKHQWTTWLNQDSAYVTGAEEIGCHVNAHFVFLRVEKMSRGHYEMEFCEMRKEDCPKHQFPYTMLYLRLMEACIRKKPAYWLWSHNRWKYDREGGKIQY